MKLGHIDMTSIDDGWRLIEGDAGAPKTGYCLLAVEDKTIAWESHQGVGYQPISDCIPHWWKPGPDNRG